MPRKKTSEKVVSSVNFDKDDYIWLENQAEKESKKEDRCISISEEVRRIIRYYRSQHNHFSDMV